MAETLLKEQADIIKEVETLERNYRKDGLRRKTVEYFKRKLEELEDLSNIT